MSCYENDAARKRHADAHKKRRIDRTGERYGKLLVTGLRSRGGGGLSIWNVRCDCGTEKSIRNCNLKTTKSCGCHRREQCSNIAQPHRVARQKAAAESFALDTLRRGVKSCTNPNCPASNPQKLSAFHRDRTNKDGRYDWCQRCKKDKRLRKGYGISIDDLDSMLRKQGNRCAACNHDLDTRKQAVDHDHKTGIVRGVLCGQCNRALGLLADSPKNIEGLLKYAIRVRQLILIGVSKCSA